MGAVIKAPHSLPARVGNASCRCGRSLATFQSAVPSRAPRRTRRGRSQITCSLDSVGTSAPVERTEAPLDIGTAAPQTERAGSSQGSGTAPASAVYGAIQGEKYVGSPLLDAGAGGPGGGGAGRNRWRWGGGGGGGGGAGGGPVSAVVAAVAGYVTARSRADPHFFFKLVAECGNDAVIIVGVNMAARGSRFLHEIEFVLCHLTVSLLCDVALVSMLAPTVGVARPATGLGAALARLPANVFEPSSIASKLGCLVYKGVLYAFTGAVMGYTGTQVVHRLTDLKEALDPAFVPPATMQDPILTGLGWLFFMGVSSNIRYQALAGSEKYLFRAFPGAVSKSASVLLRFANNVFGSSQWLRIADALGASKSREVLKGQDATQSLRELYARFEERKALRAA